MEKKRRQQVSNKFFCPDHRPKYQMKWPSSNFIGVSPWGVPHVDLFRNITSRGKLRAYNVFELLEPLFKQQSFQSNLDNISDVDKVDWRLG
jgi:hypothetical protein